MGETTEPRISPCPRRILEGGIVGTVDMGPCLVECGACINGPNGYHCMEYKTRVVPLIGAPDNAWWGWDK